MFLVRWIRRLLSLPPLWAGQLAAMFNMPASVALLKAAWWVGGDGRVAGMALGQVLKHAGKEVARAQAGVWMERRPRPQIAAFAGLLTLDADDAEQARGFLARGQSLGDDPAGGLDMLEFYLASNCGDAARFNEVMGRLQQRRDLTPALSSMILSDRAWQALMNARWEEARESANRLLSIQETPNAEMALWVLCRREGNDREARQRLAAAKYPQVSHKLYFQFLGALALGAESEAAEHLARLREMDARVARNAEAFARLKGAAV